jgi:hypothetical protein
VRLVNATVVGVLDLAGVALDFPLRLQACTFTDAPVLAGASLPELAITDSPQLPGLIANNLRVQRDLDLSHSHVVSEQAPGPVRIAPIHLSEAEIGGRLVFNGMTIRAESGRAIYADRARVGSSVRFLEGFEANGGVRLIGAEIRGSVDLIGVRIDTDDVALDFADMRVSGNVYLIGDDFSGRRPHLRGTLDLSSARVTGQILIRDAHLEAPTTRVTSTYLSLNRRSGAVVAGRLQAAAGVVIEGETEVLGGVDLTSSDLGALSVGPTCALRSPGEVALFLTNAEVRSRLRMDGATVEGTLGLDGCRIRGPLSMVGARLSQPRGLPLISADTATIEGDLRIKDLQAVGGELKIWRSSVSGSLDAPGAVLDNPAGRTLRLRHSEVGGSVRLVKGFKSVGAVSLSRSVIEGQLDCTDATLQCPQATHDHPDQEALRAVAVTARGGLLLAWREIGPGLDLTDTTCSVLTDNPGRWPSHYVISGLTYERLATVDSPGGAWDWRARRQWLRRQASYDAGPYEQAARVFRQHGYAYGAEQLLIAQRADARGGGRQRWWRTLLDKAYGVTLGYGFRPARALWLLGALLALVSVSLYVPAAQSAMRASDQVGTVYSTSGAVGGASAVDPCGRVRCFQPVLYAIDTVVPLVSLDERSTWYPDPNVAWGKALEWWLNLATLAGWLLSSIFLLSFARMTRTA